MTDPLDPRAVRSLTERLVAIPSVSPDPAGEDACASCIEAALADAGGAGAVHAGYWPASDGRRIVWWLLRGGSPRAVLCLAHHDTVGVEEYSALGSADGHALAFSPEPLRERMLTLASRRDPALSPGTLTDLAEEYRRPGTWMFGRGALDMKSGIAAGIAACRALASGGEAADGSLLFVSSPDEEVHSAGMLAAVPRLVELAEQHGLEWAGALNLDYANDPVMHVGVAGKLLVQLWVLGAPTHASAPFRGVDASQLAAAIVSRATLDPGLVDAPPGGAGSPPVVLRLRDLKPRYDVQTALEAVIELNLITCQRPLTATLAALKRVTAEAMVALARSMGALRRSTAPNEPMLDSSVPRVLTYPELVALARVAGDPLGERPLEFGSNLREPTLERVRRLARAAGIGGPAVVITLLPPCYPHAAPGHGPLVRAARAVAARHRRTVRDYYPHISDASYVAWRGEGPGRVAEYLPALGREYALPARAIAALDLDVVTLGPWGRDAHGLSERVHAPDAFGTLPRLIVETVRAAWST